MEFRELWCDLAALVWPTQCAVCGAADRDYCSVCRAVLRTRGGQMRWVSTPAGVRVAAASDYADPVRALLLEYKHAARLTFAAELGALLRSPLSAAVARTRGSAPPLVVTAPSSRRSLRRRGYRHVDLLVRAALRGDQSLDGVALLPRVLRSLPGRKTQLGLDSVERFQNAALVAVRPAARSVLRGREVIFVDDIVTTGSTARAACLALAEAGAHVLAVVALCAVERRDRRRNS